MNFICNIYNVVLSGRRSNWVPIHYFGMGRRNWSFYCVLVIELKKRGEMLDRWNQLKKLTNQFNHRIQSVFWMIWKHLEQKEKYLTMKKVGGQLWSKSCLVLKKVKKKYTYEDVGDLLRFIKNRMYHYLEAPILEQVSLST